MALVWLALMCGLLLERSVAGPPGLALGVLTVVAAVGTVRLCSPSRRSLPLFGAAVLLAPWFFMRASPVLHMLDVIAIVIFLALGAGYAAAGDPSSATLRGYAARTASLTPAVGRGVVGLTLPARALTGRAGALHTGVRAGAVVVPVVAVLVVLLGAADPVFAQIVRAPITGVTSDLVMRIAVVVIGAIGFATLIARGRRAPDVTGADRPLLTSTDANPGSAAVLVAAIAVLSLFLAVQAAVLFGDRTWFFEQEGLTAATYAREGFWQLLAAAAFVGIVVAMAWHLGGRGRSRAFRPLAIVLLALVGLLLVSANARLSLYEWAFGFTWLRILVHATIAALAIVLVGSIVAIAVRRPDRIAAVVVGSAFVVLVGLQVVDPEAFIASRNLERAAGGPAVDTSVLGELSADAWPAIVDGLRSLDPVACASARASIEAASATDAASRSSGWASWNHARSDGAEALAALSDPATCPAA